MALVVGMVWLGVILGLYLPTLQTDVNGSSDPFMIDVGEIQGALATWGTLHPSGYPLYTVLGNLVTALVRALGGTPAAGATLFSLCASLGTLGLIYLWALRLGSQPILAGTAVVLLGVAPIFWLSSVIAEVYALNLFLTTGCLLLAFHIGQQASPSRLPWLGLLWGAAVSHHRTALLLAPALLYLTGPALRTPRVYRALRYTILAFFVPFLAYLYLPLRARQHPVWVYGHPDTWSDFWYIFLSKEYRPFIQPPSSWAVLVSRFKTDVWLLGMGTSLMGSLGLIGLVTASFRWRTRRVSVALMLILISFIGFGFFYVVPDKAAMFLPALIAVTVGLPLLALSFGHLWQRLLEWGLALLILLVLIYHTPTHSAAVSRLSRDQGGRELIAAAQRLADPQPAIISLWGRDWFAYRYAKYASGELSAADILPPHTAPRSLWEAGRRIYVASHFFYQMPLSRWRERLGPVYLRSAAYGMVEVAPRPETTPPPALQGRSMSMGEHIQLLGYRLDCSERSTCYLTLYWQCLSSPETDYHVFVHLVSHLPPRGPKDILAQADSVHPVYGWYSTSIWSPAEVIRDDYRVSIPDTAPAVAILTGLYTQDAVTGEFSNLGVMTIPLSEVIQ